jgi:hypothetical protein
VVSVPKATELAAIVAVKVALPRLVKVAEPVRSPPKVIVGSEVAVVVILRLPVPSNAAEVPVTAPVNSIVLPVANAVAEEAVPVRAPVKVSEYILLHFLDRDPIL